MFQTTSHPAMNPMTLNGQTPDVITDEDIQELLSEAGEAGDREQVAICRKALAGDSTARRECEITITEMRAER